MQYTYQLHPSSASCSTPNIYPLLRPQSCAKHASPHACFSAALRRKRINRPFPALAGPGDRPSSDMWARGSALNALFPTCPFKPRN